MNQGHYFQEAHRSVSLQEIAMRFTTLKGRPGNGPCPFCGGTDRFYIQKNSLRCGCRKCGFRGDAIDLYARKMGLSKTDAARDLVSSQNVQGVSRLSIPKRERVEAWNIQEWQEQARLSVEHAEVAFEGSDAETYMVGRGFSTVTCKAFRIGFAPSWACRPAVVVPWIDADATISAVKVRYIDGHGKTKRFGQKTGSVATLFGLNVLPKKIQLLVATEGEMNAMSVWQAYGGEIAALSVGSEGNMSGIALLSSFVKLVKPRTTLLWFDRPERSKMAGESIPDAILMTSPYGLDANDILRKYGSAMLSKLIDSIFENQVALDRPSGSSTGTPEPYSDLIAGCLTDIDGYDPFAEDGTPERSPDRLLARLETLGYEPILSANRDRFTLRGDLESYMLDEVKAQRECLLKMLIAVDRDENRYGNPSW